jgi:predicted Zn-dependent peptidase
MTEFINTTRLENGLTVITERIPGLRSATLGIWVRRGSRHESPELNGICHFIEHTVFKGTTRRTALDIAIESDRMGGHLDAFTTHEMTGFTMKVADKSVADAFDLLSDMVGNPRFEESALQLEQQVIIEEMKMVEDTPDEYLGELFNAAYFPNHPLGLPIEGTRETVSSFDSERTFAYHRTEYVPKNLVIAAAGNVEHDDLLKFAKKVYGDRGNPGGGISNSGSSPDTASPIVIERKKELEQVHLIIATSWPDSRSEDRYAATLLGSIIGGGTSSRLWQSIREERGLAYSVGAGGSAFSDIGVFAVYAGTSPKHLDQVVDLSLNELRQIVKLGVTEDELQLVKEQATSSILLGLESSSSRASTLARQEIIHGRRISPDEMIRKLELVTREDVQRVAIKYFKARPVSLGALGDLNGFNVDRGRLEL